MTGFNSHGGLSPPWEWLWLFWLLTCLSGLLALDHDCPFSDTHPGSVTRSAPAFSCCTQALNQRELSFKPWELCYSNVSAEKTVVEVGHNPLTPTPHQDLRDVRMTDPTSLSSLVAPKAFRMCLTSLSSAHSSDVSRKSG
jgi:hypothetical protein